MNRTDRGHGPDPVPSAELRVVLVVRDDLPASQAVNSAGVLGASAGAALGLPVGPDAVDATGTRYDGIVTTPIPILTADAQELTRLYRLAGPDDRTTALCLTETARRARTYDAYVADLAATPDADADIVALVLAGPRPRVARLTRRLALLA